MIGRRKSCKFIENQWTDVIHCLWATCLGIDKTVLGTRDEDEALDLEEVAKLRGIELANCDGIALLV